MTTLHRLVATAGISVFAGANLGRRWAEAHAADLIAFAGSSPVPKPLGSAAEIETALLARWKDRRPTVEDPQRVSAEYSALHALPLADRARVVLLHSDTFAGRVAAALVADLISSTTTAQADLVAISDLDPDRPDGVRGALADFVHKLSDVLREGEPTTTAFAPIGGYKVMTALGYLVGAYHGYPSVYLHEGRQIVHRVPPVPVRVDEDDLAAVADLVRRTREGAVVTDPGELRAVDARPWLFERQGSMVFLNAFGQLLRDDHRYQALLGPRILMATPDELRGCEDFCRAQIRTLLDRRARPLDFRPELHHEVDFGFQDTPFALYKGSSNGQLVFRAAYRYDDATDVLQLRQVWVQHDRYEKDARTAASLREHDGPWHDVSGRIWGPTPG